MHLDVVDLRDFYASPLGRMVARQLAPVVERARPHRRRRRACSASASPRPTSARFAARSACSPSCRPGRASSTGRRGGLRRRRWSRRIRSRFPIPSVDLVILVHALEMSARPNALMAELRRVLTSGGRLIVVVPNRQGPWASSDLSPFGFGRPYSRGQLRQLFAEVGFEAETWTTGAAHGADHWRPLLGAARRLDRIGRHRLAGLRRRHRRLGGEADGAGDRGPGRGRGSSPALRPALGPTAGAIERLTAVRAKRSPGRRGSSRAAGGRERFRTRPLP